MHFDAENIIICSYTQVFILNNVFPYYFFQNKAFFHFDSQKSVFVCTSRSFPRNRHTKTQARPRSIN